MKNTIKDCFCYMLAAIISGMFALFLYVAFTHGPCWNFIDVARHLSEHDRLVGCGIAVVVGILFNGFLAEKLRRML